MTELWEAFWFFLPAGVANMSPVIANRIPVVRDFKVPVDFGLSYKGKRILGDNKTWRGVLFGALIGALVGFIQYRVIAYSSESTTFILVSTGAMGFGALVGDAVESFFKRRAGLNPGSSWFPFDQIDYIIGGILFAELFVNLTFVQVINILFIYFLLHLVVVYIFYKLGVRSKPL